MNNGNDMLETALWYHNVLGLNVIPLYTKLREGKKKHDKIPLVSWQDYQNKRVTVDEVNNWWGDKYPNAGIASVVGTISGVVVVDCDSHEAIELIESAIPDSVYVPCAQTLLNGRHYYFSCNEAMQKAVGVLPNIDFQAEGSLIVLPPTKGTNGSKYEWLAKPGSRQDFPSINIINKSTIYSALKNCKEAVRNSLQNLTNLTDTYIWEEGKRDDNLYHVAVSLGKTNNPKEYIRQVLRAIVWSWGERDEKWINAKIESALKRVEQKKRNIKEEIEAYISLQPDYISLTDTLQTLQLLTKEEKNYAYVVFNRLIGTVLEKQGSQRGLYRKINKDIKHTKFIKEKIDDFPIVLPFDLNDECKLFPKSVMVVAGSKGSGKTGLALKMALENQLMMPVVYLHSEGGDEEFSERMQSFGVKDESQIKFDAIPCSKDFHDFVTDEKKLFIIDYLEVHKDFYEVAIPMKNIHDKLKDGMAVIFIQKKAGSLYGRGNEFSQEVARLYLSMEYLQNEQCTKITIVNAKAPKHDENLSGWWRNIKITRKGTRLTPTDTKWNKPIFEEEKPKSKYGQWQNGKD